MVSDAFWFTEFGLDEVPAELTLEPEENLKRKSMSTPPTDSPGQWQEQYFLPRGLLHCCYCCCYH